MSLCDLKSCAVLKNTEKKILLYFFYLIIKISSHDISLRKRDLRLSKRFLLSFSSVPFENDPCDKQKGI